MRYITSIILTLFITATTSTKYGNGGIYCLSKSSNLNKNGLLILDFYASSQTLISDLNTKYHSTLLWRTDVTKDLQTDMQHGFCVVCICAFKEDIRGAEHLPGLAGLTLLKKSGK